MSELELTLNFYDTSCDSLIEVLESEYHVMPTDDMFMLYSQSSYNAKTKKTVFTKLKSLTVLPTVAKEDEVPDKTGCMKHALDRFLAFSKENFGNKQKKTSVLVVFLKGKKNRRENSYERKSSPDEVGKRCLPKTQSSRSTKLTMIFFPEKMGGQIIASQNNTVGGTYHCTVTIKEYPFTFADLKNTSRIMQIKDQVKCGEYREGKMRFYRAEHTTSKPNTMSRKSIQSGMVSSESKSKMYYLADSIPLNEESFELLDPVIHNAAVHVIVVDDTKPMHDQLAGPSYGVTPLLQYENLVNYAIDKMVGQAYVEFVDNGRVVNSKKPLLSSLSSFGSFFTADDKEKIKKELHAVFQNASEYVSDADPSTTIHDMQRLIQNAVQKVPKPKIASIFAPSSSSTDCTSSAMTIGSHTVSSMYGNAECMQRSGVVDMKDNVSHFHTLESNPPSLTKEDIRAKRLRYFDNK